MILFNGDQRAAERAAQLQPQIEKLRAAGRVPKIAAILFEEDAASTLYTRLKSEAAQRVGIEYEIHRFSLQSGTQAIEDLLKKLNADTTVTGIIIQKPYRQIWVNAKGIDITAGAKAVRQAYQSWWQFLTTQIAPDKDVDGLHPSTLQSVQDGTWQKQGRVLPATARAVLAILDEAFTSLKIDAAAQKDLKIAVLGRSDIVGLPVFFELLNRGLQAKLLTRDDLTQRLASGKALNDMDVVISATGQHHLITGDMIKSDSIIIDVGEPRPDVERATVETKAAFLTPVPGGVGPMTVVCLLENCGILAAH